MHQPSIAIHLAVAVNFRNSKKMKSDQISLPNETSLFMKCKESQLYPSLAMASNLKVTQKSISRVTIGACAVGIRNAKRAFPVTAAG